MVKAGLAEARTHNTTDKGRSSKRETSELSFHCLRHTATSMLKNAGVSDAVARDIIGHDSEAISRQYTHIEMTAKRKAIESLPDILQLMEELERRQSGIKISFGNGIISH